MCAGDRGDWWEQSLVVYLISGVLQSAVLNTVLTAARDGPVSGGAPLLSRSAARYNQRPYIIETMHPYTLPM